MENAVGPHGGPGALDHLWACEGRLGNRGCKRGGGTLSGIVLVCKIRDRMSKGAASPAAGRTGV